MYHMAMNPQSSTPQRPRAARSRQSGLQQMVYGLVLAVVGVILTVVVRVIATSIGASYTIVFSGLIAVGIIYALIGFFRWIMKR
jgi:uncharacterized membrane protein